jgi:hypothetical protein
MNNGIASPTLGADSPALCARKRATSRSTLRGGFQVQLPGGLDEQAKPLAHRPIELARLRERLGKVLDQHLR